MMPETRYMSRHPVTVERREDGKPSRIVGYAAVYYREDEPGTEYDLRGAWGGFVERIMPGAFDRAAREDDVRALFNHDANQILGRTPNTLRLSVDQTGLRYEIDIPDSPTGANVAEAIARGDVSGSSFAFGVDDQDWREQKSADGKQVTTIREIRAVKLYDVGPVTFPAYEATTTGIRSDDDAAEARAAFEARERQRIADAANCLLARIKVDSDTQLGQ